MKHFIKLMLEFAKELPRESPIEQIEENVTIVIKSHSQEFTT